MPLRQPIGTQDGGGSGKSVYVEWRRYKSILAVTLQGWGGGVYAQATTATQRLETGRGYSVANSFKDFSADLFTQKFGRGNTIQTDYARENKICFIFKFKHIYQRWAALFFLGVRFR